MLYCKALEKSSARWEQRGWHCCSFATSFKASSKEVHLAFNSIDRNIDRSSRPEEPETCCEEDCLEDNSLFDEKLAAVYPMKWKTKPPLMEKIPSQSMRSAAILLGYRNKEPETHSTCVKAYLQMWVILIYRRVGILLSTAQVRLFSSAVAVASTFPRAFQFSPARSNFKTNFRQ